MRESVRNTIALAVREGFRSVAFPLIGAGSGGGTAGQVAEWMREELEQIPFDGTVIVVRYTKSDGTKV